MYCTYRLLTPELCTDGSAYATPLLSFSPCIYSIIYPKVYIKFDSHRTLMTVLIAKTTDYTPWFHCIGTIRVEGDMCFHPPGSTDHSFRYNKELLHTKIDLCSAGWAFSNFYPPTGTYATDFAYRIFTFKQCCGNGSGIFGS